MNLDFVQVARASRLAVKAACRRLESKDFVGEAARARMNSDIWIEHVRLLICGSATKVAEAPALRVVRHAAMWVSREILAQELRTRTNRKPKSTHE